MGRAASKDYSRIESKYQIRSEKLLGDGRFGDVYEGYLSDKGLDHKVAMKVLKDNPKESEFNIEIELHKRMQHPFLLKYLDSYYNRKGKLIIVTEHCEKGSLENYYTNDFKD